MKLKHLGFQLYHNDNKNDSKASIKNEKNKQDNIGKFDEILKKARRTYE
jgi:hypothetical protein